MSIDLTAMQDDLVQLRRQLHRVPEVGLDLPRTRDLVLGALDGLPLELSTGRSSTSVTAVLRGGRPGPVVLLRGDMDALPLVERTGLDFTADGDAMHACGHDLHTAMLVGAATALAGRQQDVAGDVVFMFQPGEEGHDGALRMIEEGILDAAGRRADASYALHVISGMLPAGLFASRPGQMMAASGVLKVTVRGAGGHGSTPHRAKDPIPAACAMVTALQTFVTRRFDVFDPVVLTVGSFHAGNAHNVIPDDAVFEATMRSFSGAAQIRLLEESVQVVRGIATAHGVEVDVIAEELFPLTVNDVSRVAGVADVVRERFGAERYLDLPNPLTGSEDFSRVLDAVPGAMVFLGATAAGADPATAPYNHSPLAAFDDRVLCDGATLYAELALQHLSG